MKRLALLLTLLPLLAAACASASPTPAAKVPRSGTPTATPGLAPTPSLTPTATGTPPPPTPAPVEGTLTLKVNVRSGPDASYASLGLLDAGEKVAITAKDNSGTWYRILYTPAPGGFGWVAAQFVQLVSAGAAVPLEATPTPAGPVGRVLQRLNVRSGPGLTFDSLGMLEPDAIVSLTGKNLTASWFQILYPAGPGGIGWVTAQYIQADAADLPVLDDYGTPVAASASGPTPIPLTPTPTVGPAYADGNSAADPGVRVLFSSGGTRRFTYSSQVSTPRGDPADWLEFTPYAVNGAVPGWSSAWPVPAAAL